MFLHELGHFFIAKITGLKVVVFAIGFGYALCSRSYNGTEYKFNLIPLGGYVVYEGREYVKLVKSKKIAIILAGPIVSIITSLAVLVAGAFIYAISYNITPLQAIQGALIYPLVLFKALCIGVPDIIVMQGIPVLNISDTSLLAIKDIALLFTFTIVGLILLVESFINLLPIPYTDGGNIFITILGINAEVYKNYFIKSGYVVFLLLATVLPALIGIIAFLVFVVLFLWKEIIN